MSGIKKKVHELHNNNSNTMVNYTQDYQEILSSSGALAGINTIENNTANQGGNYQMQGMNSGNSSKERVGATGGNQSSVNKHNMNIHDY